MRLANRGPYRLALRALAVAPGDEVLELGFGPGEGVRALAGLARDGRIWGVDGSETMLAQARARNRAAIARGQVRLALGAFEATGLPDASIDLVLAVNVAYFWTDAPRVLAEIGRVLRPGGRLCVYVSDARAMSRWGFAGSGLHRLFDAEGLRRLLAAGPFDASAVEVSQVRVGPGIPGLVATVDKAV
jgi:ubiquinone/menaquinone biosynthesis C-methylase UbiE